MWAKTPASSAGWLNDVAAIAAELDQLSGPFVLVGHSYSGLPVTEIAAAREDVTHVVYPPQS